MERHIATKIWVVDKNVEDLASCTQIAEAAALIRSGEAVAFPTETVYGLGADAWSDDAVEKIFRAKGRPGDNPLIVHIAEQTQLDELVTEVPACAKRLMAAFWPGPLTLILPGSDRVAKRVTAGLPTVGVRMPAHPVALALIRAAGVPIAAPSANLSGRPSPTTAAHVREDLAGRIAGILDGGPTGIGVESTTLDVTVDPPMILRPGGVTEEQIRQVIGAVRVDPALAGEADGPRSPGMKYAHYAPRGELWLVVGEAERARQKMLELLTLAKERGVTTGVLATSESAPQWRDVPVADVVLACGSRADLATVTRGLYGTLREFDERGVQFIVAETFPRTGIGQALMNRLEKAAGGRIVTA